MKINDIFINILNTLDIFVIICSINCLLTFLSLFQNTCYFRKKKLLFMKKRYFHCIYLSYRRDTIIMIIILSNN